MLLCAYQIQEIHSEFPDKRILKMQYSQVYILITFLTTVTKFHIGSSSRENKFLAEFEGVLKSWLHTSVGTLGIYEFELL